MAPVSTTDTLLRKKQREKASAEKYSPQRTEDSASKDGSRCNCLREKCGGDKAEPPLTWFKLMGAMFIGTNISLLDSAFSVFHDHVMARYDVTRASLSWTVSAYIIAVTSIGLLTNPCLSLHKNGPRIAGLLAVTCQVLGCSIAAFAPDVTSFTILYGAVTGLGTGTLYLVINVVVLGQFQQNRGLASGILSLGFSLGTIASPVVVGFLLDHFDLAGALILFSGFLAQSFVFVLTCTLSIKSPQKEEAVKHGVSARPKFTGKEYARHLCDFSLLRNATFDILSIVNLISMTGRIALFTYSVNKALQIGIPQQRAIFLPSIVGLTGLLTRVPAPIILNFRIVNEVLYHSIGVALLAVGLFLFGTAQDYTWLAISMVCLGCFEGLAFGSFPLAVIRLVGEPRFPKAMSLCLSSSGIAPFMAMPLIGWMLDALGGFKIPFYIMGGVTVCVVALDIWVGLQRYRKKDSSPKVAALASHEPDIIVQITDGAVTQSTASEMDSAKNDVTHL